MSELLQFLLIVGVIATLAYLGNPVGELAINAIAMILVVGGVLLAIGGIIHGLSHIL